MHPHPHPCLCPPLHPARGRPTYQDPVKGRRCPAALDMAQHGHSCVKAQPLDHQLRMEELGCGTLGLSPTADPALWSATACLWLLGPRVFMPGPGVQVSVQEWGFHVHVHAGVHLCVCTCVGPFPCWQPQGMSRMRSDPSGTQGQKNGQVGGHSEKCEAPGGAMLQGCPRGGAEAACAQRETAAGAGCPVPQACSPGLHTGCHLGQHNVLSQAHRRAGSTRPCAWPQAAALTSFT